MVWPDLIIIDGGAGQVSAVGKVLADLGIEDVAMVVSPKAWIATMERRILYAQSACFCIRKNDPVLYFIQRMRDEAHNFVIGTHRSKGQKRFLLIHWTYTGVGASRKRALLITLVHLSALGAHLSI